MLQKPDTTTGVAGEEYSQVEAGQTAGTAAMATGAILTSTILLITTITAGVHSSVETTAGAAIVTITAGGGNRSNFLAPVLPGTGARYGV